MSARVVRIKFDLMAQAFLCLARGHVGSRLVAPRVKCSNGEGEHRAVVGPQVVCRSEQLRRALVLTLRLAVPGVMEVGLEQLGMKSHLIVTDGPLSGFSTSRVVRS